MDRRREKVWTKDMQPVTTPGYIFACCLHLGGLYLGVAGFGEVKHRQVPRARASTHGKLDSARKPFDNYFFYEGHCYTMTLVSVTSTARWRDRTGKFFRTPCTVVSDGSGIRSIRVFPFLSDLARRPVYFGIRRYPFLCSRGG